MTSMFSLDGRTAVVTGGGRGLGLGISKALLDAGSDVVVLSRGGVPDELTAHAAAAGRAVHHYAVDLGDMDAIEEALWAADLFVSIGTSGAVYPAAGFVQVARASGADTLELNLVPSDGSASFARSEHGPATDVVPAWVDELLGAPA